VSKSAARNQGSGQSPGPGLFPKTIFPLTTHEVKSIFWVVVSLVGNYPIKKAPNLLEDLMGRSFRKVLI
jgi:hypothetical protein